MINPYYIKPEWWFGIYYAIVFIGVNYLTISDKNRDVDWPLTVLLSPVIAWAFSILIPFLIFYLTITLSGTFILRFLFESQYRNEVLHFIKNLVTRTKKPTANP